MDENKFSNKGKGLDNFGYNYDIDEFGKTQEMNSIQIPKLSSDETRVITPKERFIENNSSEDMQKTVTMKSLKGSAPNEEYKPANNPVRRRRKKKKQTNHTRTMGQIFLGSVIAVASIGIGVVLAVNVINGIRDFTGMSKPSNEIEVTITSDMTPSLIAETLQKSGIIQSQWLFKSYLKFSKSENGFLDGTYLVRTNMSYSNIIELLKTPKYYTETVSVIIPEGSSAAEIGKILEENFVCRAADFELYYKNKLNSYDFEEGIEENELRFNALEGYLFPDTYEFYVNDDLKRNPDFDTSTYAKTVVDKLYTNFEAKITDDMMDRMEELDMTLDEVVILASLVQWEGTNEENMANISSVFHNRLNDPENFPLLQSDTTYTYINSDIIPYAKGISDEALEAIIDAYDTYTCEGLPAGPVCNPGLEAINAVLYPAQTNYYYFLASSDGVFYWAQTIDQHEQNIIDAALREEGN